MVVSANAEKSNHRFFTRHQGWKEVCLHHILLVEEGF
jgi:hypothetical protein